ncbi:MAG: diguanylate cyclase, partial [Candidatus Sedimenticola sp. (ex Thyasira tokunagai)]
RLHKLNKHIQEEMLMLRYTHELQRILLIPGVTEALQSGQRQRLYELVLPTWQQLKREIPKLSIMHFHHADGISFLRMHLPEIYGDPIADVRPLLAQIHKNHKPLYRFEAGKHGMFVRMIIPVFYGGNYIGAVEIGLQAEYLIERLKHILNVEGYLFVEESALSILEIPYLGRKYVNGMVWWGGEYSEKRCIDMLPEDFDFKSLHPLQDQTGRHYLTHALSLPVVDGSPKALVVLFQDITAHYQSIKNSLILNLGIGALVIIILLATLHRTTNYFVTLLARQSYYSGTDILTGIPNRMVFNKRFAEEVERCERYAVPLSLIMFDLDDFKQINDQYGHNVGDQVSIEICQLITPEIRKSDLFTRWGGDEFTIILPSQNLQQAEQIAIKLCSLMEANQLKSGGSMTISMGVSEWRTGDSTEELFKRVDENLYRAKKSGRNRVIAV